MTSSAEHANRLINEKSPYLLQHAHNPVDWYPWGEEAFDKARKENKPILLSIGYSTCHWCHVMERESFESEEVAEVLSEHFVSIKVDREERPDVDNVYMTFVQASTGHGGWPLNVWLTPELKPFAGGTYFPPKDYAGRPGFKTVLRNIAQAWEAEDDKIRAHGSEIVEKLRSASQLENSEGDLEPKWADRTWRRMRGTYDAHEGGFGNSPKFPRPVTFYFLFRYAKWKGIESAEGNDALDKAFFTLKKMADGGMYDQVGGGFHRYSVDERWHVPHFEKMLYDQGQLVHSYLEAYQLSRDPFHADVAEDALNYVIRDVTSSEGGFFSAEDADSYPYEGADHKTEGAFYAWTAEEVKKILGDEDLFKLYSRRFDIREEGNVDPNSDPHGELEKQNVLIVGASLDELSEEFNLSKRVVEEKLETARKLMYAAQIQRPRPHLDDKIITSWNALMISAFAKASLVLQKPEFVEPAKRAASFIKKNLYKDEMLLRSYREGPADIHGFSEDYAYLIDALVDLYEASGEIEWLQWAVELQAKQVQLFWDKEGYGFYDDDGTDPSILLRMKGDYDGATPSANSVALHNLNRLAQFSGNDDWYRLAGELLQSQRNQIENFGIGVPMLLAGMLEYQGKPAQLILAGDPHSDEVKALRAEMTQRFFPSRLIIYADGSDAQEWLSGKQEFLKSVTQQNGQPTAYFCIDFTCQKPVTEVEELAKQLDAAR